VAQEPVHVGVHLRLHEVAGGRLGRLPGLIWIAKVCTRGIKRLAALPVGIMIAWYGRVLHRFVASLGPEALARLDTLPLPLTARVLYGGIAEELMVRWGLMTLLVWAVWRLRRPERLSGWAYWAGALAAAFLFAIGHLPLPERLTHGGRRAPAAQHRPAVRAMP
jgi:membrane protease YdiL (CAAX protease family)